MPTESVKAIKINLRYCRW